MKITNKLGLPSPFVSMAQSDYIYEHNEYRVTSLLKGVRETILERRHADEIERDVSDMVWMLFGSAVHSILEKHQESEHEIKEERIKIKIGKYILSGQFDLYNDKTGVVTDYKTASVWKIIYGDFADWRRQILIYAYMLRQIGFDARAGQVVAFLKDHSKRDAKIKSNYPQYPVEVVRFNFTDDDFVECEEWLTNKFAEIEAAESMSDLALPLCTPEERYNNGTKYAVMKRGRKTALRVLDSEEEAEQWIMEGSGDWIEIRPGEDKKCMDYCAVNQFCDYWRNIAERRTRE